MSRNLITPLTGCLLGMALAFTAPIAIATDSPGQTDGFKKQWYLGAGIGRSHMDPDTDETGFSVDEKHDTGYKIFAGYDFTERFSLEGYYSWLGKAELSPNGEVKYRDFGLNALYYVYKAQQPHIGWGVFGRAGVGRMLNAADIAYERDNENHIILGFGAEYGFEDGIALRIDADFYDSDVRLFAINLLKRFGTSKKEAEPQPVAVVDSDNDGVADGDDRCSNSPAGVVVDSQGCERDSDGDGVADGQDNCPNTAAGSRVDTQGCVIVSDGDGDGVADGDDRCPNTPASTKVDPRGCEVDSDHDGVADSSDKCPGTPSTAAVDAQGCELDSDSDGVADSQDRCLNTPIGTAVDARGCKLQETIVLKGVTFATASAELIGDSPQVLDEVVETLRRNSELKLEIAGYTDNTGNHDYNVHLSQQRAEAVRDYLVAQGIAADRLTAKGYGPADPVADNDSEDGRATNRRVALHIIE